jgi:hypothetical protein
VVVVALVTMAAAPAEPLHQIVRPLVVADLGTSQQLVYLVISHSWHPLVPLLEERLVCRAIQHGQKPVQLFLVVLQPLLGWVDTAQVQNMHPVVQVMWLLQLMVQQQSFLHLGLSQFHNSTCKNQIYTTKTKKVGDKSPTFFILTK